MSTSEHAYWTTRKIGFQYSTQLAFNMHDVGNAHATASSRVPGATSFLITTST